MSAEDKESKNESSELKDVAATEHDYLKERLKQELGREPTEEELDDWLRQRTEGY